MSKGLTSNGVEAEKKDPSMVEMLFGDSFLYTLFGCWRAPIA